MRIAVSTWCAVAIWLVATITTVLSIGSPVHDAAEALGGAALAVFVALHALTLYRPAGALAYAAVAVAVSFGLEACSVATGFPFGFYVHHLEGPRVLGVPFTVVAAWVVLAWLAWVLARVILGDLGTGTRRNVLLTPVVATLIVGGYDLVIDPLAAYGRGLYSYGSPSGALGVPLSNAVGWILTGWVLFQAFALVERRWRRDMTAARRSTLLLPAIIWFALAAQVTLEMLRLGRGVPTVQSGTPASLSAIYETCSATAWFTMGLVAVIGVARLAQGTSEADA